MKAKEEMSQNL